ncbi:3-keto-5-aminohexanoate cleavage protein [Aeromicrobium sp. CTD01-1L150]|uniref:3-keto-5-aminohexanoate cleavage protein n=1 Tax=Aeromicrobium sp. CTD01-1L150 TaxID=3341830 RepID=UPI0035C0E972
MRLQCCVNGSRDVEEHPGVARTPRECAEQAARAVQAGAVDLHVHPRTADGRDSLAADDVATWVGAVRERVDVPVGVTTGAWAWTGCRSAVAAIADWQVLPDHASVNWHEPQAEPVCEALHTRGIAINAGLWTAADAERWLASPWREHTALVLLELADLPDQEEAAVQLLELVAPSGVPVLMHGEGRSTWPIIDLAVARGVASRIGLEDVLEGPDGELVADNAALVGLALRRGARTPY